MKSVLTIFAGIVACGLAMTAVNAQEKPALSKQTEECVNCHKMLHPGLVEDWLSSRHSRTTPEAGLKLPAPQRRVSSETVPDTLKSTVVGCYECHSLNPAAHKDNFEHFGFRINVVVSPNDCKTCHAAEAAQYAHSKKAHAIGNLMDNPVYHQLTDSILSVKEVHEGRLTGGKGSDNANQESCLACHGTKITVKGMKKIESDTGELEIPDLENWPNHGVGRQNPDGSLGACTACHPRHGFSLEVARKPHTCAQCHLEPDVPAWDVYRESKHGNLYASQHQQYNWDAVPWTVGKDFRAPTCAACHSSLIASPDGEVLAPRTHDFGERLWVRIFGLPYSHPQPKQGDTTNIKNKDGLPLPTAFTGEPSGDFLIGEAEQTKRRDSMKNVCKACHNSDFAAGFFVKFDKTLKETDRMVLAATHLVLQARKQGVVDASNPFDESLEQKWIRQWLFYANSVRYGSAMSGPDLAGFKNGWWHLNSNLQEMKEYLDLKERKNK